MTPADCEPATVTASAPFVPFTTTLSASCVAGGSTDAAGEVHVQRGETGSGQVIRCDGVRATKGVGVDALDAIEIHDDARRRRG